MNADELKTRDRILSVSFGLFLQKGFDDTSVQTIIDAVGIAKGTFYHHFASKDDMLVSLVDEMTDQVIAVVAPVVHDTGRPVLERILEISRLAAAQKASSMGPATIVVAKQMRRRSNRQLAECLNTILHEKIRPLYLPLMAQAVHEGVFHLRHPEWAVDLMLKTIMSFQDEILDGFIGFFDAASPAEANRFLDRLQQIYEMLEESLERQLGAVPGSLPIYTSINLRDTLSHFKGVSS